MPYLITAILIAAVTLLVIAGIVAGPSLFVLARVFLTKLAKEDTLFTFIPESQFVYVMAGGIEGKLIRVIGRIPGEFINPQGWILPVVRPEDEPQKGFLEEKFHVTFFGITPNQIAQYPFVWDREYRPDDVAKSTAKQGYDIERDPLDPDHKIVHRSGKTKYLKRFHVYPFIFQGIETSDGVQVTIRGTMTIRAFNVHIPVIDLKGHWFPRLRAAAAGAAVDYIGAMTLKEFRAQAMLDAQRIGQGSQSELEKAVLATKGPLFGEAGFETSTGTVAVTGMGIVDLNISSWDTTKTEVQEALEEKELSRLRAEGRVAEARGTARVTKIDAQAKAEAITLEGEARAGVVRALVEAAASNPVGIPVILGEQNERAISAFHGATLVLGTNAAPVIPLTQPPTPSSGTT